MNVAPITGIVDLHHHILPSVDDGAPDLDTALELARQAVREGIATVMATPHTLDGCYQVSRERARAAHAELLAAIRAAAIPLEVRLAAEVRLHEDVPELLRESPDVSLDGQGRFLLLELPQQGPPPGFADFLFRLRASGTTPIIAHPERYFAVREQPEITAAWVELGAHLQLTAGSLTGAFGPPIRACAQTLLHSGRVAFLATDAHSLHKRPPLVQAAFAAAANVLGEEAARALVVDNPRAVLASGPAAAIRLCKPRRKRAWFRVLQP
jgi:protein-tyrosine phosphatase